MISAAQIQEILSLYKKHGWTLRRVLLTEKLKDTLADFLERLFGEAEIVSSDIDAVWFSRISKGEREAWEIRHLSQNPYALVEVFDAEDDEEVREESRHEIQERLRERVLQRK
jgi:hypothetical protein